LAISKARKTELVTEYADLLEQSRAIFLTDYKGMSVKQLSELRAGAREVEGRISVTKNTLLRYALEETGQTIPDDLLSGQTAAGFALGEAPALAKALVDFAKAEELFVIKGALLDGRLLSPDEVEALAKLPSKEQLRAQIMGLINAPARNLASVVASGVRQVVNVIDAYSKKEEAAEAAEA
jgi:large subunit ribosomal protein L10